MRKWAQVSAWLHIHLCSCSQIQSRYFWFDSTTKGPRDGWKMRRAPTCHFNPTCFHSRALPSWPLPVRSALPGPHPDIRVFNPTPPVPRPHVQPVTSVPSPLGYTSLLQHSNSRARLCLICMHKLVVIIFEHFKWATTSTNWCLCFPFSFLFFFLFYTRALGCYLIQCEDITWSLPEIICWIGEKEPWSPVIQTDTSLQTASIHPSTRTRRRESRVSSHQSSFISTKWQFLWVSGTVHSVMLSSWNMAIFNQREPYLRKILMNQ